jgi:hypothetical protein
MQKPNSARAVNATRRFLKLCNGNARRLLSIVALLQALPSMAADLQSSDLLVIGRNLDQA